MLHSAGTAVSNSSTTWLLGLVLVGGSAGRLVVGFTGSAEKQNRLCQYWICDNETLVPAAHSRLMEGSAEGATVAAEWLDRKSVV